MDEILDSLQGMVHSVLEDVNTAVPGQIVSYDGTRAVVKPSLSKQMADGATIAPPQVVSVPVVWPGGLNGGKEGRCTFPLGAGAEVLLVFSQRSLEEYLGGGDSPPQDPHRFDLSDAIAIPRLQRSTASVPLDRAVFEWGAAKIELMNDGGIRIGNEAGGLVLSASGAWSMTGTEFATSIPFKISGVTMNTHVHPEPDGRTQGPING